jgi:nucleotide-binding universal stress UspA family protein
VKQRVVSWIIPPLLRRKATVILIAYDGSPDSQAAIDRIAALLPGTRATVLTVWQPYVHVVADSGGGMGFAGYGPVDVEAIDNASTEAARATAEAGAARARQAGLEAEPVERGRATSVAEAILEAADELKADTIAVGTRGRTGLRSLLLGSVSHALLQHADRTVIVIPSEDVARERRAHRHPTA